MINTQNNFLAIGAVVSLGGLGSTKPQPALSHTNRFEVGNTDDKGCFCPCKPQPGKAETQWTVNNPGKGKADIDLGNYTLQLDESNSQMKIVNKNNGEVTNIWGDPHIDWNKDGKTDANFWGTTTFQLEDGTKITVNTEPYKNNKNEYVSSEVTVTRGENAMKITGLSQNELGDLKIETADRGGQALDWATKDGFVVKENSKGEGWVNADTGKLANQKDFDVTKPGAEKPYEFTQSFGQALGVYLAMGFMSDFAGLLNPSSSSSGNCHHTPSSGDSKKLIKRAKVEHDANTVNIHHANGSHDTRSGGTLAWRTNNPGLLPFNAATRSLGAIGEANGVAVFANEDRGQRALAKLLLGALR